MFLFNNFGFNFYNNSFSGYSEKNIVSVGKNSNGLLTRLSEAANHFFNWVASYFSSTPASLEGRVVVLAAPQPEVVAPEPIVPVPGPELVAPGPMAPAPEQPAVVLVEAPPAPEAEPNAESEATLASVAKKTASVLLSASVGLLQNVAKGAFSYGVSFLAARSASAPDMMAAPREEGESAALDPSPKARTQEEEEENSAVSFSESDEEGALIENNNGPVVPPILQANAQQVAALKGTLKILSTLSVWTIGRQLSALKKYDDTLTPLLQEPLSLFLVVLSDGDDIQKFRKIFYDEGQVGSRFKNKITEKLNQLDRRIVAAQLTELCQKAEYKGSVEELQTLAGDGKWNELISKIIAP